MKVFNQKQLAICVMLLSAVPFPFLAAGAATGMIPAQLKPALPLHVYSAMMIAFIAGTQWAIHFCKRTQDSVYFLSAVILLVVLASLLVPGSVTGLVLLVAMLLLSWVIEFRFSRQRVTTVWYWRTRNIVSTVALLSLVLALLIY